MNEQNKNLNNSTNEDKKNTMIGCCTIIVILIAIIALVYGVHKHIVNVNQEKAAAVQEQQKKEEAEKQENIIDFSNNEANETTVTKLVNQQLKIAKEKKSSRPFPINNIKLNKVEFKESEGKKIVILNTETDSVKHADIKNDTASIVPYLMPELFKNSKVDIVKIYMTATATKETDKQEVTDELANITFEKTQDVDYEKMKTQNDDYIFKIAKASGIANYIQ